MLVAIDIATGQRVMVEDIPPVHRCHCPECNEELMQKRGRIVVWHFAHHAQTRCSLSQGESPRHLQMKRQLLRRFLHAEVELPIIMGRRADLVLVDKQIVVECQASPISIEEWEARTLAYSAKGYAVMWVWDIARIYGKKVSAFPPNYDDKAAYRSWIISQGKPWLIDGGEAAELEYRVCAEVRHCAAVGYGEVFALDCNGALRICELRDAETRYREWYDEDGELQEAEYTPTSLKRLSTAQPASDLGRNWTCGRFLLAVAEEADESLPAIYQE